MNSTDPIMPVLAAADWIEVVAALVFFIVTGIAQWLQKRSRERRGLDPEPDVETDVFEDAPPQPRETLRPSGKPADSMTRAAWEEHLRRMLTGEQPAVPPRMGEQPPGAGDARPVPRSDHAGWEQAPAPPRLPSWEPRPQPVFEVREERGIEPSPESPARENVAREMARAADAAAAAAAQWTESARRATEQRLAATRDAYQQARAKVAEKASRQLQKVRGGAQPYAIRPRHQGRKTRPPMAEAVVRALRDPMTARQTIIAATILERPKSME